MRILTEKHNHSVNGPTPDPGEGIGLAAKERLVSLDAVFPGPPPGLVRGGG